MGPITQPSGKARWIGRIGFNHFTSAGKADEFERGFTLNLDFTNKRISSSPNFFVGDRAVRFTANWNPYGLLAKSTFRIGDLDGTLTGIIGVDGVVAAFKGNTVNSYAGGFVAGTDVFTRLISVSGGANAGISTISPLYRMVTANLWESGFDGLQAFDATNRAKFVFGASKEGDDRDNNTVVSFDAGSSDDNGFVIYTRSVLGDNDDVLGGFAGILPTTNLGAPITETLGGVTWLGTFRLHELLGDTGLNEQSADNFVLDIDFVNKRISSSVKIDSMVNGGLVTFDFSANWNDAGLLINGKSGIAGVVSGDLTGIIGQDGVVGVFKGSYGLATGDAYYGGLLRLL